MMIQFFLLLLLSPNTHGASPRETTPPDDPEAKNAIEVSFLLFASICQ